MVTPTRSCRNLTSHRSSDTLQLKWDQHQALTTPFRKLLKIHGPSKCLAENKFSTNVFSLMYLLECGFCFKHSLGHHIQVLDIVLILASVMGHLDFFELLEWDGTGF